MRKYFFLLVLKLTLCNALSAQVICVSCYDQNARISTGINNLILNSGFENTTCTPPMVWQSFCPNSFYYLCDISNWTCTGGGVNTYARVVDTSFSVIPEGTKAVYFGNWFWDICSADTNDITCFNNQGCIVTGIPPGYPTPRYSGYGDTTGLSLEQTVTGLTPCVTYVLEFWAGGELNPLKGLFSVDVGFGKIFMREKPTPHSYSIGTRYLIEFVASSSSHIIKFTHWGHISQFFTELVLDDVRLYSKAELSDTVLQCVEEPTDFVYNLPNVFTPDGDGFNDLFHPCDFTTSADMQLKCPAYVNVSSVNLKFFNRWGKLVFETSDRDINWDGKNKFSGKDCPDGVYYFTGIVNFSHLCSTST